MILPHYQINVTSDERTNSLIVRAPDSIQIQIQKILEVIDNPMNTKSVEILKINHIPAQDIAQIIQNVINYKYINKPGICIGDNKSNKIIILEENKNIIDLKNIVNKLDIKTNQSNNSLIYKLKNAKPDQISNLLNFLK